jgi:cytosine/adenosine deaminase-related metal-dependent hydrolase
MDRKISASRLFDGYHFRENQTLILSKTGVVKAIVPTADAGDGIEFFDGILTPGFINCHCHLELSHMKGKIPERTGLVDFVFKVVTERNALELEILSAIAAAEEQMMASGIVAVGDICNNTLTLPQKQKHHLQYYNFIEASGWLPAVADTRLSRSIDLQEEFRKQDPGDRRDACSIVPHAPYSVSEALWQAMQPYFAGKVVSIHNQETQFEDEFFQHGTGDFTRMYNLMKIDNSHHQPTKRSSLQSYFDKLQGAEKIILVHNTFTTEEDVLYVKRQTENVEPGIAQRQTPNSKPQTFFCLCVNANQYIEGALPPIEMLRKNGCNIVLGTDSLASNWSLSIADEIKTIRNNFPAIPLEEILCWATINGAKALSTDRRFGSFDPGKTPGAVLFNEQENSAGVVPLF